MGDELEKIKNILLNKQERVYALQRELTAIPALGPENGGQGENLKAAFVENLLLDMGIRPLRADSPDPRVASGTRPNLVARVNGRRDRTLWLFGHLDVVPPGDESAWRSNPWEIRRDGDLIFGRGVEDNQQAVASMLILAESLMENDLIPQLSLGLVFMADEECGSKHGLAYILRQYPNMFHKDDFYIVPDGGSESGEFVEVAEKAQLWLRFETIGRQCHASMPEGGKNAFVAACRLVCALQTLPNIFSQKDHLYRPNVSTFTPTRHEANSPSINVLPGKDVFYMDCRLLPECPPETVLKEVESIAAQVGREMGVEIKVEIAHLQKAAATPADTPAMKPLSAAIQSVYGVKPLPLGIGGATVAAFLREKGLPALVWSRIRNTCHQPNECSSLSSACGDAAVFAEILLNGGNSRNA